MQITFDYDDIQEALQLLIKKKMGTDLDLEEVSPHDYPSVEYRERVYVYKKHKNGREVKDENGFREVDWDKSEHVTKHIQFDDSAKLTVYVSVDQQ